MVFSYSSGGSKSKILVQQGQAQLKALTDLQTATISPGPHRESKNKLSCIPSYKGSSLFVGPSPQDHIKPNHLIGAPCTCLGLDIPGQCCLHSLEKPATCP